MQLLLAVFMIVNWYIVFIMIIIIIKIMIIIIIITIIIIMLIIIIVGMIVRFVPSEGGERVMANISKVNVCIKLFLIC